ncbi:MAG TPA: CAP domain-containing protein [Ornithinibacter sp.]|nr:CAP domain-containing protein [Ornithinibacter sp.]
MLAGGVALALSVATAAPASALPTPGPSGATTVPVTSGATRSTTTGGWLGKTARAATVRTAPVDTTALEVLRLANLERAKVRCPALRWESRLATAARLHSEDMARRNYFSHTSLDGRSPWDRIRAQGYAYGSAENIAAGQSTPAAVMTAWMNSSGHRANILNCSNKALGVGIGKGGSYGTYWTQDFGRS